MYKNISGSNIYSLYHEDGKFISDLETNILRRFETGVISKTEMLEGYTETLDYNHLQEVKDIIEEAFQKYKPD